MRDLSVDARCVVLVKPHLEHLVDNITWLVRFRHQISFHILGIGSGTLTGALRSLQSETDRRDETSAASLHRFTAS